MLYLIITICRDSFLLRSSSFEEQAVVDDDINFCRGSSVVERKPEELSVVGSIPIPGTNLRQGYGWQGQSFYLPFLKLLLFSLLDYYTNPRVSPMG